LLRGVEVSVVDRPDMGLPPHEIMVHGMRWFFHPGLDSQELGPGVSGTEMSKDSSSKVTWESMTPATVRGKLMASSGCRVRKDHQPLRGFMHRVIMLFSTPRSLFSRRSCQRDSWFEAKPR